MILWFFFILLSFSFAIINGEHWLVEVGVGGKQVFVPDSFDANVGDLVTFQFVAGTHSVIMSDTFGSCVKSSRTGFTTGIYNGDPKNPSMVVSNLSDVGPIYYFCGVADHCSTGKMYATINVFGPGQPLNLPGLLLPKSPAPKDDTLFIVISVLAGIFGCISLIIGSLFIIKKCKKSKNTSKISKGSSDNNYNNNNNNFEYDNNIMSIPGSKELSQKGVSNPGQEIVSNVYSNPGQEIVSNVYSNPGQEITQQQQDNLNINIDQRVFQQLKQELLKDMRNEINVSRDNKPSTAIDNELINQLKQEVLQEVKQDLRRTS